MNLHNDVFLSHGLPESLENRFDFSQFLFKISEANDLLSFNVQGDYVVFPNHPGIHGVVTKITYEKKYTRPKRRGRRFYYTAGLLFLRPKYHVRFLNVPTSRFFYENQLIPVDRNDDQID